MPGFFDQVRLMEKDRHPFNLDRGNVSSAEVNQ